MEDLISRRAAIDELKACRGIYCDNTPESFSLLGHSDKSRVDEIDNAIAILVNLPSAQQWIPIEDRPPEFGKDVLISHHGFVSIDWLTQSEGNAYFFASRVAIADIDAWMPLPSSFREGGEV